MNVADDGMRPIQRLRGILAVLGYRYEAGTGRDRPEWRHPGGGCSIDAEAVGEPGLQTDTDLVKFIFRQGYHSGRDEVRTEIRRALGIWT